MKKIFLIGIFALLLGAPGFAQQEDADTKRIQEMRVAFFEQELQLSPEESEAFWPIYSKFRQDQRLLKKRYRANRKLELMTDEEAEAYVDEYLELEQKQLELKRAYVNQLRGVINIRKIAMINRTERKFKHSLLNKIQNRRQNNPKRGGQFN